MRRVVVLINSFRRKSGVHPVMSPRQIIFGKKFKTPLCKIGELVMAYDTTSDNKTTTPRAFYALYIGPDDGGTGHQVFKLSNKRMIATPKCRHVPMPDNVIEIVNDLGKQDDMPNGIKFLNIHKESTLADLFADEDLNDDDSNASDEDWGDKKNPEDDLQLVTFDKDVDDVVDGTEVQDLHIANGTEAQDLHITNEDILHLNDGSDLSCNISFQHENEDQHNHFGGPAVNKEDPDGEVEDQAKDVDEYANVDEAIHLVGNDESNTDNDLELAQQDESKDEYDSIDEDDESIIDEDGKSIVGSDEEPEVDRRPPMVRRLYSNLDGIGWESTGSRMVSAMMVAEQAGVRMMKEYFEIEASKATPQY